MVVNICYRHTPQFSYPIQHNDAFDSFDWVYLNIGSFGGDVRNLVVGGVSAGANLAAAVVLRENLKIENKFSRENGGREWAKIKGQILVIPWLIVREDRFPYEVFTSKDKSSRVQCADAPVLPQPVVDFFAGLLHLEDDIGSMDRYLDVGLALDNEVVEMPRTSIVVAGRDPLRDDGLLYAKKLHRNGYLLN